MQLLSAGAFGLPRSRPTSSGRTSRQPTPSLAPAPEAETEEEAEERRRNYEQQRKEYEQGQERKAEERKQQFDREQQEQEPSDQKWRSFFNVILRGVGLFTGRFAATWTLGHQTF